MSARKKPKMHPKKKRIHEKSSRGERIPAPVGILPEGEFSHLFLLVTELKTNWDSFLNRVSSKLMNYVHRNSTSKGMTNHQTKRQEESKVNSAKRFLAKFSSLIFS